MLPVEFSHRADMRFQQLDHQVQQQVAGRLKQAQKQPRVYLTRNYGYRDYTLNVPCSEAENHVVIIDWERNFGEEDCLYIITLGPGSRINRT